MYGKQTFFTAALPKNQGSSLITSLKEICLSNKFYNMPEEAALGLMNQMNAEELGNNIGILKSMIIACEKIDTVVNQYLALDPAQHARYCLAKLITKNEHLLSHPGLSREFVKKELGFNGEANDINTIIANYETMQEILRLSSQLRQSLNQSVRLLEAVQEEKLSRREPVFYGCV